MFKKERGSDAALFEGMTLGQIEKFSDRIDNAATRESRHGNYDLSNDLHDVHGDLHAAWTAKWDRGER